MVEDCVMSWRLLAQQDRFMSTNDVLRIGWRMRVRSSDGWRWFKKARHFVDNKLRETENESDTPTT